MNTNLEDAIRQTLQVAADSTPYRPAPPIGRLTVAAPRRARRWPKLASVAAAAGVATTATVLGTSGAAPAAADVRFTHEGGYIVASFADPDASTAALRKAFQRQGLNIVLQLLPVSPSMVGTIVYSDTSAITPVKQGHCVTGGGACPIAIRIPTDFTGPAHLAVGRRATATETYASTAVSSLAPGEALHCSGLLGKTVAQVAPALRERGLRPLWRSWRQEATGQLVGGWSDTPPPGTFYVQSISPRSADSVYVDAEKEPYAAATQPGIANFHEYNARLNAGC